MKEPGKDNLFHDLPVFRAGSPELLQQINDFYEIRENESLLKVLSNLHPADIAEVLEKSDFEKGLYLFRLCSPEIQSETLVELDDHLQGKFINELEIGEVSPIVDNLESDQVTNLLSKIQDDKAEEILGLLDKKDSLQIRTQLNFREYTAGRLMNKIFVLVNEGDFTRKAIVAVRRMAKETSNIYQVYVQDENLKLTGFIKLNELFLAPTNTRIAKITQPIAQTIHYNMDQEEVAKMFRKYDLVSAPVVDDDGRMLGRITVDDILDIFEEEASEDFLRIGGVSEDEKLSTPVLQSVKRRIAWLHLNLLTAFLAASVVSWFGPIIEKYVILAALMPIVAGMGGNAGTQAITIVVRNLATGDLTQANWFTGVRKELIIGIINGVILGIVTGVLVYVFQGNLPLSLVLAAAMLINLFMAGLVGSMIPIILKIIGVDPAIASSIFVTTVTDVCGFFSFLGLASIFIGYLNG